MQLDSQGRTLTQRLGESRLQSRDISELIGVCKGVLADGSINVQEAQFILRWLQTHQSVAEIWPADYLHTTLSRVLQNGSLSSAEEGELLDVLVAITGVPITIEIPSISHVDQSPITTEKTFNTPSTLPLNEPDDGMNLDGAFVVLTGNFLYGTRAECEAAVTRNGGIPQKTVIRSTKYLVIGEVGSESWAQSSFGRKIEKAVAAKDAGQEIYIVGESYWEKHLSKQ